MAAAEAASAHMLHKCGTYTHTHAHTRRQCKRDKQKYIFGYYKLMPGEFYALQMEQNEQSNNNIKYKNTTFYKAIEIGLLCERVRQTERKREKKK